jgi:phosphoribosyl 1,2-cyclic phosphate phosphodiesterase
MRVTVLGCGGSGGVPLIGGYWGRCNPDNPKNRRRRVSVLVEEEDTIILIDTSPDVRAQLLDAGVTRVDAVLYTHDHADHSHGIDELRALVHGRDSPIDAFGSDETMTALKQRFGYIFESPPGGASALYKPILRANVIEAPFDLGNLPIVPFDQDHGFGTRTMGYRLGRMAYSTDVVGLPPAAFEVLAGIDLWIVDCLRLEPHPTHAHFDLTLAWIERVKPERALLTHLNHTMDYDAVAARCPKGVEPAYDGQIVEVP